MNIGAQRDATGHPPRRGARQRARLIAYVVEQGHARERVLELGMATRTAGWRCAKDCRRRKLVLRGAEALSAGAKVKESAVTLPPPGSSASPAALGSAGGRAPAIRLGVPIVGSGDPATARPPAGSGGGRRRDRGGDKPPPAPPAGAP